MRRGDMRRLQKLETPDRADYVAAVNRTLAWTLRLSGVELEVHEEADLRGYTTADFDADCGLMARYRASLDPARREREQRGLLRRIHRELERRRTDP